VNSIGLAVALIVGGAFGLPLVGLYPAGLEPSYGIVLLVLALFGILVSVVAGKARGLFWAALLTAFFLAGCGRSLLIHPPVTSSDRAYYNSNPSDRTLTVVGVVSAEPVFSDRSQRLRITARSILLTVWAIRAPSRTR
jgi:hypothetical protein